MVPLHLDTLLVKKLIKDLPVPIIIINEEGQILFANDDTCILYGYTQQEIINQCIFDFSASQDGGNVFRNIIQFSIKLAEPSGRFVGKHKNKFGKIIDIDLRWSYIQDKTGVYLVLCIEDITELKKIEQEYVDKVKMLEVEIEQRKKVEKILNLTHQELKEKIADLETQKKLNEEMLEELAASNELLERLAMEDSLTGIYNRRYFSEYLETEIIRAQHLKEPLSLLIVDLDHFKQINDTFGHLIGDKVLITVAKRVQSVIGNRNILCRYGGEEFAVISLGSSQAEAIRLGESILVALNNKPITLKNSRVIVTASIGISSIKPYMWKAPLEAIRDYLIKTADKALYRAKGTGRNKVESFRRKRKSKVKVLS